MKPFFDSLRAGSTDIRSKFEPDARLTEAKKKFDELIANGKRPKRSRWAYQQRLRELWPKLCARAERENARMRLLSGGE